jgi:hypothetical protein
LVPLTCSAVDIGQQAEAEFLGIGECLVVRWWVKRGADYDAPRGLEVAGPVTQGLAFDRSTRG